MENASRAAHAYEDTNIVNLGTKTTMHTRTVDCRHGKFTVFDEDELVGLSLVTYGEYSEGEVSVFNKVLQPGDVAIDVGANIGALTIPMARLVGEHGKVHAFEASRVNFELLQRNVQQNNLVEATELYYLAASDHAGRIKVDRQSALHAYCRPDINVGEFEIACITIDDLGLKRCKLIKIDVDGHELEVLNGAVETIARCRPVIYIENEIAQKREAMVAWLIDHGYRLFWHRPYLFNIDNWRGDKKNIFGALVSIMNVCIPDEVGYEVQALEEVSDYRDDDAMFLREAQRYMKYVERDPDDLQSRWMAAHYGNLMQWREWSRSLINDNLTRDHLHTPTLALRAYMNLQDGQYGREGWAGYEIRHKQPNRHQFGGDRAFLTDRWEGEPTDKPVLIWSEQGFGDNIMFARFFSHVLKRAPNAFLEVRPELFELFEHSGIAYDLYRLGRTLPPFELQLPLPSTAWALGADEAMIRTAGPYLFVDPLLVANWRGCGNIRLGQTPDGPLHGATIGLCHKGSATSERPYTRDIPKELLMPLVRKHGPVFPLEQTGQFELFAMTAAAIKALDLVITVDTSIAHLAGALGVPTWLLLSFDPDFRWGLQGSSTIWYPSLRIFRQPKFRDWQSVIDEVMAELEKLMNILFRCVPKLEGVLPRPAPAAEGLPGWIKAMPQTVFSDVKNEEIDTVKKCPPFIDAMTCGFLMPLATDVRYENGMFYWDREALGGRAPIDYHENIQVAGSPMFDIDRSLLKFNNYWTIKTPPGYSVLLTHPVNRYDLPFITATGLVDSDRYCDNFINFPARWHAIDFNGTLPKGTPIAQCIPVKRESWAGNSKP